MPKEQMAKIIPIKQETIKESDIKKLSEINSRIADIEADIDVFGAATEHPEALNVPVYEKKGKDGVIKKTKKIKKGRQISAVEQEEFTTMSAELMEELKKLKQEREILERRYFTKEELQEIESMRESSITEGEKKEILDGEALTYIDYLNRTRTDWDEKEGDRILNKTLSALKGNNSSEAWHIRSEYGSSSITSLTGIDTERAWRIREQNSANTYGRNELGESLIGLYSKRAQQFRKKLNDFCAQVISVSGSNSKEAWNYRNKYINNKKWEPVVLGQSLAGIDNKEAWKLREVLFSHFSRGDINSGIGSSLAGIDSEEANKIRRAIMGFKNSTSVSGSELAKSLIGLNTQESWEMREYILINFVNKEVMKALAMSLAGINSKKASEMRRYLFEVLSVDISESFWTNNVLEGVHLAWKERDEE